MRASPRGGARKPRAKRRPPADAPARRRAALPRIAPILIVAACAAAYANSLDNPFLFDDQRAIVENASIRELAALDRVLRPPRDSPVTGRPLSNLSFALNYAAGGLSPRGYHVVNVAVHALAALALFGVLRRTFAWWDAGPGGPTGETPGARGMPGDPTGGTGALALVAALVWAVHPLVSEVVNYVTQRTESMMGLFYLLALYCAIRAADASRPMRWELAAAFAALCAIASKEMALTLPIVIALWDRVFAFQTLRAAWAARRRLYGLVALSWLLFLAVGRAADSGMGGMTTTPWTYLVNQAPLVVQYLKLSVWPVALVFDYGVAQPLALSDVWPSATIVVALLAATGAALWYAPPVGFWCAWFFVTLAPTTSVIPIPIEVGAERRMYLPLAGGVVLAVTGASALGRRWLASPLARRRVAWASALGVLALLATGTVRRNAEYLTGISIWQTVLERRPHWRAHEHLSVYLRDAGRMDESIAHLRIAAADSPDSQHALAAALLDRGDLDEAIPLFREFIRQHPRDPEIALARRELASALMTSGDAAAAIRELRALTADDPDDIRSRLALAEALERAGDRRGALEAYRAVLSRHPDDLIALSRAGVALAEQGQVEAAVPMLRRALELEPRSVGVRLQLTQILLARGEAAEAEQQARTLVSQVPEVAEVHNLLGVALASLERLAEARAHFAEAVRLDPGHRQARANLERIEKRGRD